MAKEVIYFIRAEYKKNLLNKKDVTIQIVREGSFEIYEHVRENAGKSYEGQTGNQCSGENYKRFN